MVHLIEIVSTRKDYQIETFFLAVNIADRYLRTLTSKGITAPSHVLLGITVLIIAGKANESVRPCFEYTAMILPEGL